MKKYLLRNDWVLNSKEANKKQQTPALTMLPQQHYEYSPAVVAEAMVFVAKIGATVAAATGVPVLKMVFYEKKNKVRRPLHLTSIVSMESPCTTVQNINV